MVVWGQVVGGEIAPGDLAGEEEEKTVGQRWKSRKDSILFSTRAVRLEGGAGRISAARGSLVAGSTLIQSFTTSTPSSTSPATSKYSGIIVELLAMLQLKLLPAQSWVAQKNPLLKKIKRTKRIFEVNSNLLLPVSLWTPSSLSPRSLSAPGRPRSQLSRSCFRPFCRSSTPFAFRLALLLPGNLFIRSVASPLAVL